MDRIIDAIDLRLNAAVMTIAGKLFPTGYDLDENPPTSLKDLQARLGATPRRVWSGASDATIYGDEEVNYAFRAWHDYHYWRSGLDFAPHNEAIVAEMQCSDILKVYGDSDMTRRWCDIIRAEVIGQTAHYYVHGDYPRDQMSFVRAYLEDKRSAVKRVF